MDISRTFITNVLVFKHISAEITMTIMTIMMMMMMMKNKNLIYCGDHQSDSGLSTSSHKHMQLQLLSVPRCPFLHPPPAAAAAAERPVRVPGASRCSWKVQRPPPRCRGEEEKATVTSAPHSPAGCAAAPLPHACLVPTPSKLLGFLQS